MRVRRYLCYVLMALMALPLFISGASAQEQANVQANAQLVVAGDGQYVAQMVIQLAHSDSVDAKIQDIAIYYQDQQIGTYPGLSAGAGVNYTTNSFTLSDDDTKRAALSITYTDFDGLVRLKQIYVSVESGEPGITLGREILPHSGTVSTIKLGDTITIAYTITNTGNATLEDIHLSDALIGDIGTIVMLSPGQSQRAEVEYKVIDAKAVSAPKVVFRTISGLSSQTYESQLDPLSILPAQAKLTLTLKADKTTAQIGDEVTLTLSLINEGNMDLKDIKISEPELGEQTVKELAAGASFVSPRTIKLAATKTFVVSVTALDAQGKKLTVTSEPIVITVSALTAANDRVVVTASADVTTLTEAGKVTFSLHVINRGPEAVSSVKITESTLGTVYTLNSLPVGDKVVSLTVDVDKTTSFVFSAQGVLPGGSSVVGVSAPVLIEVSQVAITLSPSASVGPTSSMPAGAGLPADANANRNSGNYWMLQLLLIIIGLVVISLITLGVIYVRVHNRSQLEEDDEELEELEEEQEGYFPVRPAQPTYYPPADTGFNYQNPVPQNQPSIQSQYTTPPAPNPTPPVQPADNRRFPRADDDAPFFPDDAPTQPRR